jgi:hypothetical protein
MSPGTHFALQIFDAVLVRFHFKIILNFQALNLNIKMILMDAYISLEPRPYVLKLFTFIICDCKTLVLARPQINKLPRKKFNFREGLFYDKNLKSKNF